MLSASLGGTLPPFFLIFFSPLLGVLPSIILSFFFPRQPREVFSLFLFADSRKRLFCRDDARLLFFPGSRKDWIFPPGDLYSNQSSRVFLFFLLFPRCRISMLFDFFLFEGESWNLFFQSPADKMESSFSSLL